MATGSLNVLIAGAGIGGLTLATALRKEGHTVTVFERSRQNRETGAAIHVAPNAHGLVKRLGLDLRSIGSNLTERLDEYGPEGDLKQSADCSGVAAQFPHSWELVHRVNLHKALQALATNPDGPGKPAKILTAHRVVDVDCKNATIILDNGERISGDVVIGADGVHSETRHSISGEDNKPFGSGKSGFRFLIPRQTILDDPKTARFVQHDGKLGIFVASDRRIVMYPCDNNTLINFMVMYPSAEVSAGKDWDQGASMEQMLGVARVFGPDVLALISKADPATLKVWELLDMAPLTNWTNGCCALLGDAAHPFLPHQGQGGAQAIEDAMSLAVVLQRGTPKEEIAERLKLYQRCRMERAHKVQHVTRLTGRDQSEVETSSEGMVDFMKFTQYNFGHDEWEHSSKMLHEWQAGRQEGSGSSRNDVSSGK